MQGLNLVCANTNEIIILRHYFDYDYFVVVYFYFLFHKGPSGVILKCYLEPSVGSDLPCCIKMSIVM